MLRESYMSSSWLAWCYVRTSPARFEQEQLRLAQLQLESIESAARTAAETVPAGSLTPALEPECPPSHPELVRA